MVLQQRMEKYKKRKEKIHKSISEAGASDSSSFKP